MKRFSLWCDTTKTGWKATALGLVFGVWDNQLNCAYAKDGWIAKSREEAISKANELNLADEMGEKIYAV